MAADRRSRCAGFFPRRGERLMSVMLPNYKLNKRVSADSRAARVTRLEISVGQITMRCAGKQDTIPCTSAHHFRTPSPCGQLRHIPSQLPTFYMWHICLIERSFAALSTRRDLSFPGRSCMVAIEATYISNTRGPKKCESKHGSSQFPHRSDWLRVETRSRSKRSWAQEQAQPQPLCWMASHLPVPLSAPRAICSTVRPTRISANRSKLTPQRAPVSKVSPQAQSAAEPPCAFRTGRLFRFATKRPRTGLR